VVFINAASLPDRVGSEDRGDIVLTEAFEHGGVAERPIDPLDAVQSGELNSVGHLHPHVIGGRTVGPR
jgi:hypothetical protein